MVGITGFHPVMLAYGFIFVSQSSLHMKQLAERQETEVTLEVLVFSELHCADI